MLTTDLLDREAVRKRLGYASVNSFDKVRERGDKGTGPKFPEPARYVGGRTPLWLREDIDRFGAEHPRLCRCRSKEPGGVCPTCKGLRRCRCGSDAPEGVGSVCPDCGGVRRQVETEVAA